MLRAEMPGPPRTWPLARPDLDSFETNGSKPVQCLLLHGFTASPMEMKPLADALRDAGFPVRVLRLPGHGTSDEDLALRTPDEWIGAADDALATMSARGPVFLAGQSMGGLISLLLAAAYPERVAAIASLAAPLWFGDVRARILIPLLRWTPLGRFLRYVPKGPSAIPAENLAFHFTYTRFPTAAVVGLDDVMKRARRALPTVKAPLLVLHGAHDRTAPPVSARRIVALAGSAQKRHEELAGSRHVLTWDVEAKLVCEKVVRFFEEQAARR